MHHERLGLIQSLEHRFGASLKNAIRLGIFAAVSETTLASILFTIPRLSREAERERFLIFMLIALTLYALSGRMFKKELHRIFETWIAKIRLNVMDAVRRTDLRSFERIGADELYTALTFDVRAVSELSHTIAATIYALFLLLGVLLYLALLSEPTFLLTLAVAVVIGALYDRNHGKLREMIKDVRAHETALFGSVADVLDGFKELRLNNKKNDAFFAAGIEAQSRQLRDVKSQTARHLANNYVITYGLWMALAAAPLFGYTLLGFASKNVFMTCLGMILFIPTNYLVEEIPKILLAGLSLERLAHLETTLNMLQAEEAAEAVDEPEVLTELTYDALTFHYDEPDSRAFTIGPFSLTLRPAEIVFLTGGNGSGKTTLLKLLTGLYPVDSGEVRLNGQPIVMAQHRALFGAIFGDVHLFDRLHGLAEVDPAEVTRLLTLMQLDEQVQYRDQQFSTLKLSSGQRKRLAMVVTLLEDRPLLVFDEWAAEQDPYFRAFFYETLLPDLKRRGKAILAVTHDERYFHAADRLLNMEEGKVRHEVTHS